MRPARQAAAEVWPAGWHRRTAHRGHLCLAGRLGHGKPGWRTRMGGYIRPGQLGPSIQRPPFGWNKAKSTTVGVAIPPPLHGARVTTMAVVGSWLIATGDPMDPTISIEQRSAGAPDQVRTCG